MMFFIMDSNDPDGKTLTHDMHSRTSSFYFPVLNFFHRLCTFGKDLIARSGHHFEGFKILDHTIMVPGPMKSLKQISLCLVLQLRSCPWVCRGINDSKQDLISTHLDALVWAFVSVTLIPSSPGHVSPPVSRITCRQRLIQDSFHRLRTLFGFGWFFEWEGGRHPLNSTWPWSNVKPSVLVIWGVCWMFVLANYYYRGPTRRRIVDVTPLHLFPHRHEHNVSLEQEYPSGTGTQTIKEEPSFEYPVNHLAISRCDCDNKAARHPRDEAYHHYAHQATRQPILTTQRQDHRHLSFQAEASHYSARTAVTPAMSNLQRNGYLVQSEATNKDKISDSEVEENQVAESSVAFHQPQNLHLSPQISGFHPENDQHYDVHRPHNGQYHHSEAYEGVYTSSSSHQDPIIAMSLYEGTPFQGYPTTMMQDPSQDQEDIQHHHHRYPTPPVPMGDNTYNSQSIDAAAALSIEDLQELQQHQKEDSDPPSPGRSKPIPKPDREITKDEEGRYICNWAGGCTEDVKTFNRRCEWNKHMDKHDRPYKCPADGCEKLPGFTYSGGLLRHQREVHNLHGGPKKQLNCPHQTCKRFSGKGFSRQENLNEHLRRVHTDGSEIMLQSPNGNSNSNINNNVNNSLNINHGMSMGIVGTGEETEDEVDARSGMKRKRTMNMAQSDESVEIRQEMARLRNENEQLKKQSENMSLQIAQLQTMVSGALRSQLQQQQQQQQQQHNGSSHQAPQASMM